ncbi:acyl-CoA dehydrogenase NM domain-like protein [Tilletiopsis washingtonensis]|uniref:Acyl-CoA dehydrogenase NM domain-like protein n=1 Tax=Tilletiopsis washingtonensis TaxID=58919 RepID=A0A316Z6K4_9BASI|nr:acyl-CoA dehydrogenase NM domain-like protein [Tilletiopsis washingtonensis]PWN97420.1 acyl-CoA dehydrogenase NM domain-like protein [Tilletiopsis washingtonensis]
MSSSSNASLLTRPTVPFAEAAWHAGLPNPYYTKRSHYELREWLLKWVADNLMDIADEWEDSSDEEQRKALFQKFVDAGFMLPFALGVKIPERFYKMAGGLKLPGNVEPSDIMLDELNRCASNGLVMGNYGGTAYGAGPIVHFASPELQERILPDILTGKKRICLAITEPNAGSDVANVSTTAKLSADGKYYVVNGLKKWITNGIWSDYFTTAVRTSGKPGEHKGISFLVIPRTKGVSTKAMKMQSAGSGTTIFEMDDVHVPVENLVGKEGEGFKYIRMTIVYVALRFARGDIEDATNHANRRVVFGKKLIEQPVVRHQLAHMAREVEALQAWTESLVFQQSKMTIEQSNVLTGGSAALLKAHSTIVLANVVREAGLLLGGMGLTKGGAGARIERIYREVNALMTPGGARDVMLDAGIKQAIKTIRIDPSKL